MTDTTHATTIDAEEAILRTAWAKAVDLFRRWSDATERAIRANRQGITGGDDQMTADTLRIRLDALVIDHAWQNTYVDPMVNPTKRLAYLSPVWPPAALPEFGPQPWPPQPVDPAAFPIRDHGTDWGDR